MIHHSCKKIQTFILISYTHGREILHCEVKVVSTCPNHLSSCQSSLQQESGSMVTHLSVQSQSGIQCTMYCLCSPHSINVHACMVLSGLIPWQSCTVWMYILDMLQSCPHSIQTGMSRLHSYCQVLIPYITGMSRLHSYCQVLIPYITGMSRLHSYCQVLIPCQ